MDLIVLTGYIYMSVSVVEFRTEELMKKAVEKVNKHNLNGRPLKVKEVSDRKNAKEKSCWELVTIEIDVELQKSFFYGFLPGP